MKRLFSILLILSSFSAFSGQQISLPPGAEPVWKMKVEKGVQYGNCYQGLDHREALRVEMCYTEQFDYSNKKEISLFNQQGGLIVKHDSRRVRLFNRIKNLMMLASSQCPLEFVIDRKTKDLIKVNPTCDEFSE